MTTPENDPEESSSETDSAIDRAALFATFCCCFPEPKPRERVVVKPPPWETEQRVEEETKPMDESKSEEIRLPPPKAPEPPVRAAPPLTDRDHYAPPVGPVYYRPNAPTITTSYSSPPLSPPPPRPNNMTSAPAAYPSYSISRPGSPPPMATAKPTSALVAMPAPRAYPAGRPYQPPGRTLPSYPQ